MVVVVVLAKAVAVSRASSSSSWCNVVDYVTILARVLVAVLVLALIFAPPIVVQYQFVLWLLVCRGNQK